MDYWSSKKRNVPKFGTYEDEEEEVPVYIKNGVWQSSFRKRKKNKRNADGIFERTDNQTHIYRTGQVYDRRTAQNYKNKNGKAYENRNTHVSDSRKSHLSEYSNGQTPEYGTNQTTEFISGHAAEKKIWQTSDKLNSQFMNGAVENVSNIASETVTGTVTNVNPVVKIGSKIVTKVRDTTVSFLQRSTAEKSDVDDEKKGSGLLMLIFAGGGMIVFVIILLPFILISILSAVLLNAEPEEDNAGYIEHEHSWSSDISCEICEGSGNTSDQANTSTKCLSCNGLGYIQSTHAYTSGTALIDGEAISYGSYIRKEHCNVCSGEGASSLYYSGNTFYGTCYEVITGVLGTGFCGTCQPCSGTGKVYYCMNENCTQGYHEQPAAWMNMGSYNSFCCMEPIEYTIDFDSNGGTGSMESITAIYDEECRLPANRFTREGYEFLGWARTEHSSMRYMNKAKVINLSSEDGETVILYAVWKKPN